MLKQKKKGINLTRLNLTFSECEHDEDLARYRSDVIRCGGLILHESSNYEEETCDIGFEVADRKDFIEKFRKTESYGFSQ